MLSVGNTEDCCGLQECVPVHVMKDGGVFVRHCVRICVGRVCSAQEVRMSIRVCRQKGGAGAYSGLRFGTVSGRPRLRLAHGRAVTWQTAQKRKSEDSRTKTAHVNETQKRLSRISASSTMLTQQQKAAAVIQSRSRFVPYCSSYYCKQ